MITIQSSKIFKGSPAAPGLKRGPALVLKREIFEVSREKTNEPSKEKARLKTAIKNAASQISKIADQLRAEHHDEEAAVFNAHIMLIEDKSLHKKVALILDQGLNVEAAWADSIELFASQLEKLPDPTLCLRAADLRDAGQRVLKILLGRQEGKIVISEPSIIVAADLTPSETVSMERSQLLGFCTAEGGPTSHTAILAKTFGIPAVVNLGHELLEIENGEILLLNGETGEVIASPEGTVEEKFINEITQAENQAHIDIAESSQLAVTIDGVHVEIVSNIANVEDAKNALLHGAEGVGLLRTEFLFLERENSPTEEEQYLAYKQIFDILEKRPVVVRTLDAGGDKTIPYLNLGQEANPFLGCRAIRLCLEKPEFFKTQLRALLRAGIGHNMRIMFPMIATLEEVREAKRLLADARSEVLFQQEFPDTDDLQVGIMVEIPSVAVMADMFAREVDFFSIGTNDLTQYTMAADRTNPKVSELNDYCHPAVIRLVQKTTQAAHAAGKWVGVCGEMAGDLDAIPILLGIGVDELSMSPSLIPRAKSLIRKLDAHNAELLLNKIIEMESAEAVRTFVKHSMG